MVKWYKILNVRFFLGELRNSCGCCKSLGTSQSVRYPVVKRRCRSQDTLLQDLYGVANRLLQQPPNLYNTSRIHMNVNKALLWLSEHQPLPDDLKLTQEVAESYDKIRKFFLYNPDSRCIPLFLNSFGGRNGWGVYQLIEDVLRKYQPQEVLPHLVEGFKSSNLYVRHWSAEIAASFPDPCLVGPLSTLLADKDYDVKAAAIIALQQITDNRIPSIFEVYLQNEEDKLPPRQPAVVGSRSCNSCRDYLAGSSGHREVLSPTAY